MPKMTIEYLKKLESMGYTCKNCINFITCQSMNTENVKQLCFAFKVIEE